MLAETIATYASDCTTPKSTFTLGETVCAITDNVDLGFPGGRWVHWLRPDLSIAFGSSTTTLITTNPQTFTFVPDTTGTWKVTIAETGDISQTPAVFTVAANPPIATYDPTTCTILQDNFTVGDMVCAKADNNFTGSRLIYWVDSQGGVVETDTITPTSPSATYQATQSGNFRVYLSDGDSLLARAAFTVSDPQNPKVDLSVLKYNKTGELSTGNPVSYAILVTNNGPDSASTVSLTDAVPSGLAYFSSSQDSGPTFTQTLTDPTTTWEIATLAPGATATFTITYTVSGAVGTTISNSASITNNTEETHNQDNTSSTFDVVSGGGAPDCSLDCPNNIVTTATTHGAGGGATVTFAAPDSAGTCGTITSTPPSGSFFPIGTTTVTSTSSTGNGFCSFTVTVIDSPAPTISCPANTGATANSGEVSAFVPNPNDTQSNVGTATATGTNVVVTGSREDGEALTSTYPIGVTKITWTATEYDRDPQDLDAQPTGRSASCQQTITVISTDTPTITCPSNKTFTASNGCTYTATAGEIGTPTTTGPNVTVTSERSDGLPLTDPFPSGFTTIEWTATNSVGSASCTQTITVNGNVTTAPTLSVPPNVTVTTNACGQIVGESDLGTASASDACGPVSVARTGVPPGNFFPTGTTTVTYTATNAIGTTTGTQTVMVLEDPAINPTITAPNDVTLFTGAGATSCGVTVTNLDATLGTATASDNCPGVVVTRIGVPAGNVFPVGNTTITYRATDRSGNFTDDTQVVTVVDNTPPIVTPPPAVTLYTGAGATSCSVTVTNLDATLGTGSATDNCPGVGAVSRSGVPSGNVFPVGQTTLTYSATDAHGNTGTAQQVVTVVDNTPPTITCPANIVLEPTCPSGAIATYAAAVVGDNCGVQSQSEVTSPTPNLGSGSVFPIGTTTVTRTVTDIYGNTASCSFTVTVKTALAVVEDLKVRVAALQQPAGPLSGQQVQGLTSKLEAARLAIIAGQTNVACNKLNDFISQVTAYINNGTLTSAQGQPLINSAKNVRNTLGCTNNPCT